MKRIILLLLPAMLHLLPLSAQQTGSIKATLLDRSTKEPVPGAVIEVTPLSDSTKINHYTSAYGGAVNITGIAYGDYKVRITFLGYKEEIQTVKVNRQTVNLGQIMLAEDAIRLGAIEAVGQAMRSSQKGDTIVYNADAFKVARDADTESLLSKMPGIKVVDGEVEAQGETVKKVFVDGREFFGQDVSTAIRNLPAEVVSKIEVYNKLSDNAEFTGIDDGEGFKAINVVTNIKSAQFGKIYGGYGFDEKYIGGANVNWFAGDHRFSILSMLNNMNQQNFSQEDILGALSGGRSGGPGGRMSSRGGGGMRFRGGGGAFSGGTQDGTSTVQAFGLNYMGNWGQKIEANASYFFRNTKNTRDTETGRQYIDDRDWIYKANSHSLNRNTEHTVNARLQYKINDNHTLMMRPQASFQRYRSESVNDNTTTDFLDDLSSVLISSYDRTGNSKNWGYNLGNNLIYRVRLGKAGRTLTTDVGGTLRRNDAESYNINYNNLKTAAEQEAGDNQYNENYSKSYNLSGSVTYTEPVSQYSQVTASYRANYSYSDSERLTYLWDEAERIYDKYFDPDYTNVANNGNWTHRVGPGYNYRKDKTNFNANVNYQRTFMTQEREYPTLQDMSASFDNIVYFGRVEHAFNPQNTIRIHARSSTSTPSINQLQDVIDMSNTQYVTAGNPDLRPSYSNNFSGEYRKSNITKGTTFTVMGMYGTTSNSIANDVLVAERGPLTLDNGHVIERGGQFTTYTNLSGSWNVGTAIHYGFPFNAIRSNVNLTADVQYRETPSMTNKIKNTLKGQYYATGIVVGSNISENIDFTVNYDFGYNVAKNTIRDDYNNEYLNHYISVKFKWVAWLGFTLSGNASYSQNKGITEDYNDEISMINLYLGKKMFRNQRGELTFGVNDLLNQKKSFRRNVTTEYLENVTSNAIGRYYGFQFVYNLRNYGKPGASSSGNFRGRPEGLRDGGPPPGMMPPGGGMPF